MNDDPEKYNEMLNRGLVGTLESRVGETRTIINQGMGQPTMKTNSGPEYL